LIAASYRRVSLRETRLRRAAGFFTVFLLRCGKSHCRLRASLVSFAQIIDEPGKRIRARVGFRISVSSFGWADSAYSGNFEMD
jgi:hypothetical protein